MKSNKPEVAADFNSFSTYTMWHRRLGHAHAAAIKTVLDLCKVNYQSKSVLDFCSDCCLGKAHRLHSPLSNTVYNTPFELIFSDLWGLAPYLSSSGYSFNITFVDSFSRYTWIYFLKNISDALAAFNQFYNLINTQFSTQLKAIQTDWGKSIDPALKFLMKKESFIYRLTCPHTSRQNGIVERKHRQIVEMGLTLLAQAKLPYKYWDHSLTTYVHLINRLPTAASSKFTSLFHSLYKHIPDYNVLTTFGLPIFLLFGPTINIR